jgi:CubicO group peptidase (beta-lactamase class C family)/D-alanyl-D-alanine dipeptidase
MQKLSRPSQLVALAATIAINGCAARPERPAAAMPAEALYGEAVERLREMVAHEMNDKGISAVSIALIDDQEVVWAEGFGMEDPGAGVPATASTVYRVGSVSKLFTDLAVMQLVERGELSLDTAVSRYLPDFTPENPFGREITLRQLMSHRSGLVREPPVGSYFDSSEPSLEATVRSLDGSRLVYEPGTRVKYSNAAIAVVGFLLEATQHESFARYVERAVLRPLGMERSSFEPRRRLLRDMATAYMWTLDGREFEAPTFELGIAPAGSMYSTVLDLGRFVSAMFAEGEGVRGRVVAPETLREMWTPQPATSGRKTGYGLGFSIGDLDGDRRIGHGGAIYGFATELAMLPERKLGVVVAASEDLANAVTERIADAALRMMTASREGRKMPRIATTSLVPPGMVRRAVGRYSAGDRTVELRERSGGLEARIGELTTAVRWIAGDTLIVDSPLAYGPRIVLRRNAITVDRDLYRRIRISRPAPIPTEWEGLIGEYGWDHNTLYILERDGRLEALIEWFFSYPLERISPEVYSFPDGGLYAGEKLFFFRDDGGRAIRVVAAGVPFERRRVGTVAGETFRIDPVRPVDELRARALSAQPPRESGDFRQPDLVEITRLDPSIRLDIRYASTNNFMNAVFYREPRAFLQRPAAEALVRVHRALRRKGFGLLIHDAYRPWYVTRMFWDATPPEQKIFVADPAGGSRHNRGAAVDLTLFDLATNEPVRMVGGYDEFSPRSFPHYPGGTSLQRWHRDLLRDAMEAEGFSVYDVEWWHFDHQDWREYPILNLTFEEIDEGPVRDLPGATPAH